MKGTTKATALGTSTSTFMEEECWGSWLGQSGEVEVGQTEQEVLDPDRDSDKHGESSEDESDVVNFARCRERLTGDVDAVVDCRYVSVVWFAV